MTNTERKLDEARYFLEKLNINEPYFDYIFSAFINAARSTTWIMRNEFSKVKGWEQWFSACQISEEEKLILKKTNNLRLSSVKETGVKTEFHFFDGLIPDEKYYPVIEKMLHDLEGQEIEIRISDEISNHAISNPDEYRIRGTVKIEKDESELSRAPLHLLCNAYYNFLEKQVNECVAKFGNVNI